MIKIGLLDLIEEYGYNKTLILNSDLEISNLKDPKEIHELEDRNLNLQTKIDLIDKYDFSYILTEKEISMIKSLHTEKPCEKIYEKFKLNESDFDNWISILKKKLKKINIYIAQ